MNLYNFQNQSWILGEFMTTVKHFFVYELRDLLACKFMSTKKISGMNTKLYEIFSYVLQIFNEDSIHTPFFIFRPNVYHSMFYGSLNNNVSHSSIDSQFSDFVLFQWNLFYLKDESEGVRVNQSKTDWPISWRRQDKFNLLVSTVAFQQSTKSKINDKLLWFV
jgi:hypothetical protein